MKKIVFFVLMAAIAVFSGFSQAGIVREFTGDVELKPAGATAFTPAQAGATIAQDTIVATGFKSTAIIAVGSTTIMVRPLTRLSLAEIQSSEGSQSVETLNVSLQTGRLRVDVKPPAGTRANATVQTPSATASVRGTEFFMDNDSVIVDKGMITFKGRNGLIQTVNKGFSSKITGNGSSSSPSVAAAESLKPSAPSGSGLAGENNLPSAPPSTGELLFEFKF
ncbi:MAG: FecR family protein [Treponema sp.]|jgi:hypothetical protein|nr:FecR family protein [Treponema sp.]